MPKPHKQTPNRLRLRDVLPLRRVAWPIVLTWLVTQFLRHVLSANVPPEVQDAIRALLQWMAGEAERLDDVGPEQLAVASAAESTIADLRSSDEMKPWQRLRNKS